MIFEGIEKVKVILPFREMRGVYASQKLLQLCQLLDSLWFQAVNFSLLQQSLISGVQVWVAKMHRTSLFCLRNFYRYGQIQQNRCANGVAQTVLKDTEEPSCSSGDFENSTKSSREAPVVFVLNEADVTRLSNLKLWQNQPIDVDSLTREKLNEKQKNKKTSEDTWVEQTSVPLNKRLVYYSRLAKARLSGKLMWLKTKII